MVKLSVSALLITTAFSLLMLLRYSAICLNDEQLTSRLLILTALPVSMHLSLMSIRVTDTTCRIAELTDSARSTVIQVIRSGLVDGVPHAIDDRIQRLSLYRHL